MKITLFAAVLTATLLQQEQAFFNGLNRIAAVDLIIGIEQSRVGISHHNLGRRGAGVYADEHVLRTGFERRRRYLVARNTLFPCLVIRRVEKHRAQAVPRIRRSHAEDGLKTSYPGRSP